MLKILQAVLKQYVNCELPDVQDGFRKGRRTRDQIANIHWIIEKARKFQKNSFFFFLKRWEYHITWYASWEICVQVKKQQLELDMEQ